MTTQWISSGDCTEKEQKQQEYRNYYCDTSGDHTCKYTVTQGPKWVDTGNTRNKADGTSCTNGTCQNGVCVTAPQPGDAIANYDISAYNNGAGGMDYDGTDLIVVHPSKNTILLFDKTGVFQWESPPLSIGTIRGVCYVTPYMWCVTDTKLLKYDIISNSIIGTYDISYMSGPRGISASGDGTLLYILDSANFKIYYVPISNPTSYASYIDLNVLKTWATTFSLQQPVFQDLWKCKTGLKSYLTDSMNNCIWGVSPGDTVIAGNPLILHNSFKSISARGIIFDGTNFYIADGLSPDAIGVYKPYSGTYY